jgi:methionyl-tRNA formyltransferase
MKFGLLIVGEKGRYVLEQLVMNNNKPEFVISYSDSKVVDNSYVEISNLCLNFGIKFFSTKDDIIYDLINDVDKTFVIGWQFLFKKSLNKLVVIHDSYLPEYKGWSPTVNYLIEGSPYLAATAFEPSNQMDTGDIYEQIKTEIDYPIKINEALRIVSELYLQLIYDVLNGVEKKPMVGQESFTIWRNEDDYNIDWSWDGDKIVRFVDAVGYPFDCAKIKYDNCWYKVIDVSFEPCVVIDASNHYGKILKYEDGCPYIVCNGGLIKLNKIEELNGNEYKMKKIKIKL